MEILNVEVKKIKFHPIQILTNPASRSKKGNVDIDIARKLISPSLCNYAITVMVYGVIDKEVYSTGATTDFQFHIEPGKGDLPETDIEYLRLAYYTQAAISHARAAIHLLKDKPDDIPLLVMLHPLDSLSLILKSSKIQDLN